MSFDAIRTASVIRYPYLWARQADSGETEGRKDRPVAVGVRIAREGGDRLLLLPITTSPPGPDRRAIEVPAAERRLAGLDADRRLWIILDEYNLDIIGRSFHLAPDPPIGRFSQGFFLPLMRTFLAGVAEARRVARRP